MQLYKLVDQLKFLEDIPPDEENSDIPLQELVKSIQLQIDTKVINIAQYVLSLKSDVKALKDEEDRLSSKRKAVNNRIEWLKGYLFSEMRAAMKLQIKSETCTVSIRTNPPSAEIINIDLLPERYKRITIEADKKSIIEHYKLTGEIIQGVNIITDKESIVIR